MQPYQWLFFDLDNTLFDFDRSQVFALEKSFEDFNLNYFPEINGIYTEVNRQCWLSFEQGKLDAQKLKSYRFELLFEQLNLQADAKSFGYNYLKRLSETDFLVSGARELLDHLKPNYQLAIITNGLKIVQRPRIRNAGLTEHFQSIVVSEEIGIAKPYAGFFDVAFQQAKQPNRDEVLVIGDSLNSDIKGGNAYGVDTCWMNPNKKKTNEIQPTFEISALEELIEKCGL